MILYPKRCCWIFVLEEAIEVKEIGAANKIDVSIILINYKTPTLTSEAINSIVLKTKGVNYEIIVVDNSSSEDDFGLLRDSIEHPVTFLNPKNNLGFGRANNLGVMHAKGRAVLFLNSDTQLVNNAIYEMYCFLFSSNKIGAVGANLFTKDLKANSSFFLEEKNTKTENASYLFQNIRRKLIKNYFFNFSNKPLRIHGYVCGACLMIKKDVFDSVRGFDDDIFMYAEDSLLCREIIHTANKEIYNLPNAKVIHYEGGSFSGLSHNKASLIVEGNYTYYLKSFGHKQAFKYIKNSVSRLKKKAFFFYALKRTKKGKQVYDSTRILLNSYLEKLERL